MLKTKFKCEKDPNRILNVFPVQCKYCNDETDAILLDDGQIGTLSGWYLFIDKGDSIGTHVVVGVCPKCAKNIGSITFEFN